MYRHLQTASPAYGRENFRVRAAEQLAPNIRRAAACCPSARNFAGKTRSPSEENPKPTATDPVATSQRPAVKSPNDKGLEEMKTGPYE